MSNSFMDIFVLSNLSHEKIIIEHIYMYIALYDNLFMFMFNAYVGLYSDLLLYIIPIHSFIHPKHNHTPLYNFYTLLFVTSYFLIVSEAHKGLTVGFSSHFNKDASLSEKRLILTSNDFRNNIFFY